MARIQPGLERIAALLKGVDFPWKSIHVAGTNGKGSICHYASSMLVGRSIKVGKFTSPHLVDRWDCISIDGKPIEESKFRTVERHFLQANTKHDIGASPFEILTATAFTIFNDMKVKVGVIEVGMGGKLDSTNILNNQAVSVISKIARDHEGFLGNTLSEIAGHKAGILRPNVPFIINPANEANVQAVIEDYAQEIGAGPQLLTTSFDLNVTLYDRFKWSRVASTLLPFQQENLKLAVVAVLQMLQNIDQEVEPTVLANSLLSNTTKYNPGRQEMVHVTPVFQNSGERRSQILVDGAHNPDAAAALDTVVNNNLRFGASPAKERPESGWPVTWILAMTEGKDARKYLATLLKPGDNVVTTTFGPVDGMPWVKPMDPKELLELARSVEPQITGVHVPVLGALRAVCTAKYLSHQMAHWSPTVLTGSLYLVGDLHRELRPRADKKWWTDTDPATVADRESFIRIQAEERERVGSVLSLRKEATFDKSEDPAIVEQRRLQEELDALNREVDVLEIKEQRIAKENLTVMNTVDNAQPQSAAERLEREDQHMAGLYATQEQIATHIARAEKLKASLARGQQKLEAAAKARAEQHEIRRLQREGLAQQKARKAEKRLEKEQRMLRAEDAQHRDALMTDTRERSTRKTSLSEQLNHPFQKSEKSPRFSVGSRAANNTLASDGSYQDILSVLESSRPLGRAGPRKVEAAKSKATERAIGREAAGRQSATNTPAPSKEGPEDDITEPEPRESSRQLKSMLPWSGTAKHEPQATKSPKSRVHQEDDNQVSKQDNQVTGPMEDRRGRVRIVMHYANASQPRKSKLAFFPKDRQTRAWSLSRSRNHPGYKNPSRASVINYYAHDYGRKPRE